MNRRWLLVPLSAVLISLAALLSAAGQDSQTEQEKSEIAIGLRITPVPLNLENKDILLVGLGSYIVNAQASCASCHSCPTFSPGHNPYLGQPKQLNGELYLAGGTPFGPFVSRNLTPDESGKPAGLSEEQFRHVLATGEDPDHPGQILQVMPWPALQNMTDHDIRAVYEYLRAIPRRSADDSHPSGACTGPDE